VVALSSGRHHMLTGDLDEAIRRLEAAGDEPYALMRLGYCYQARGEHTRARSLYEQSVRRFEEANDGFGAAGTMGNLSLTVGELGDLDQSHAIAHRMLEIARKLDHGPLQTSASQLLGAYALRACRLDEATRWLDEAARLAHHFGYTDRAFLIDLNRAELLWEQDDLRGAARLLDECLTRSIAASTMLFAQILRGTLAHDEGDLDTAEQLLTTASTLADELGLADRQVFAGLSLGPLLAERDRSSAATTVLDAVGSLVHTMQDTEGIALVHIHRIHLLLTRYREQPSAALRQEIVRTRRRLPAPEGLLIRRAHRLLDRVGARSGIRLSSG
jgi:tetratricopeptide (TPR) repeat protein